jgi:hypothetical protein
MVEVPTLHPISQTEAAMDTVTHPPKKGYRTLRLPLAESEYDRFVSNRSYAKARLDELYEDFPELFPEAFHGVMRFTGLQSLRSNRRYAVDAFVSNKAKQSLP